MENKVMEVSMIDVIGEYGIVKVKEEITFGNGKVFMKRTFYDVCLEHGDGDIVASFGKVSDARRWVKEN